MSRAPTVEGPDDRARHYEDYTVGETVNAPGVSLTESDIIDFAKQSIHGGLIASGWQVGAASFRMLIQSGFFGRASMGSSGLNNLRWPSPTRPGDTLYARVTVLSKRESRSRPELGLVEIECRVENQRGEVCCTWDTVQLVLKRPEAVA